MAYEVKHATQTSELGGGLVSDGEWDEAHDATMATARLLGRTTASAGAVEEIAPGPGLLLTAGELRLTDLMLFGSGADGDVTVTTGITLTRDMFYDDLTITSGGSINTAGYRIFVAGTLDLTAAPANAIQRNGNSGSTATSSTAAAGAANLGSVSVGGSTIGNSAGSGATGASSPSSSGIFSNVTLGGGRGGGGAGAGSGGNGSGGSGGSYTAPTVSINRATLWRLTFDLFRTAATYTILQGGTGGLGGVGGAGDGTAGGGGGGAGGGAGVIGIWARKVNRGGSTTAGAISAKGGAGGAGFTPTAGNRGGGGGGSGGGGGWVYMVIGELLGSTATNLFDVSGGDGGNAGSGSGTGTAGTGGQGGDRGSVAIFNLAANLYSESLYTDTPSAHSGATGGTGVAGLVSV